jgi:hypothetical protein
MKTRGKEMIWESDKGTRVEIRVKSRARLRHLQRLSALLQSALLFSSKTPWKRCVTFGTSHNPHGSRTEWRRKRHEFLSARFRIIRASKFLVQPRTSQEFTNVSDFLAPRTNPLCGYQSLREATERPTAPIAVGNRGPGTKPPSTPDWLPLPAGSRGEAQPAAKCSPAATSLPLRTTA